MDKNYIVKKSNYFIMNTSYDLSLEEQKLILTLASMVQPTDEEFKPYNFRIADFMELLGVNTKTKYTEIPKITKDLMKKVFEIEEGNVLIQTAWLSGARYEKGSGMVTLKFNPDLKPYMLQLNSMFTQYKLANILSMKSKYSPRIYELLKCNEYKKQGYIDIEIDDLRQLLKAENIYPRYYDFRRFILESTQKELEKLTDISFEFEEMRYGRKVKSIRFYIKSKNIKQVKKNAVIDEISATVEYNEELNIETGTREVLKILQNHKVKSVDALKIYQNANGDLNYIKKIYDYSKTQNVKNLIGFMKDMVLPGAFKENIRTSKVNKFTNYTQREYNYDDLEKGLLGWDKD